MMKEKQDNVLQEDNVNADGSLQTIPDKGQYQGKAGRELTRKQKSLWFYCLMMAIPLIQFFLMYVCVNLNSILLSFKEYTPTGDYIWLTQPFTNFEEVFSQLKSEQFATSIKNSLTVFGCTLLINLPLSLFFSYYIYKGFAGSKAFRVALYLPNIVSSIVMVTIFYYIMDDAIPLIGETLFDKEIDPLISNPDSAVPSLIAFSVLFSFGSITMVFASSMSSINESVMEAATLDGCNAFMEFIYIIFPLTFNVIKLQLLAALVGIFTNQLNLYTFFDINAYSKTWTIGYYLYRGTLAGGPPEYPFYAAMWLILTLVAVPIILSIRKLLDRFDPYNA